MDYGFSFFSFCRNFLYGGMVLTLSLLLAHWMIRVDIQDHPVHRSSHSTPTRSGGVAIAASFSIGILYLLMRHYLTYVSFGRLAALGIAIMVTCLVSFKDDIKALSFMQKFLVPHCDGGTCSL